LILLFSGLRFLSLKLNKAPVDNITINENMIFLSMVLSFIIYTSFERVEAIPEYWHGFKLIYDLLFSTTFLLSQLIKNFRDSYEVKNKSDLIG